MRKLKFRTIVPGKVLNVLAKAYPLLPVSALRNALKQKDIRVNGVKINQNINVRPGDELIVYTSSSDTEIPVIYEDEDCLLLNKPAGLNSDRNHQANITLIDWANIYASSTKEIYLVHRLDNQTSGLVLLAKGLHNANQLKEAFKNQYPSKTYTCLVLGLPEPSKRVNSAWLYKDAKQSRVFVSKDQCAGSKAIKTSYHVLEGGEISRLCVQLYTGRTHQIRAHLAFLGHPILGDEVYGNRQANRNFGIKNMMLCATGLAFPEEFCIEGLAGKNFHIRPPF